MAVGSYNYINNFRICPRPNIRLFVIHNSTEFENVDGGVSKRIPEKSNIE